MHGRAHQDRQGCRRLGRSSSSQHMRPLLPLASNNGVAVAGDSHSPLDSSVTTSSAASDSFLKDGRKIIVGDCALFKPPKDSRPFIGLIRWLALNKENNLQLGVNCLYRSSEAKLGKEARVDIAPNEIFYSFHREEIPATSLLHPCKVAFLPRGVELPTGTSSFVCRRAYDIANKCLWWLTDEHYINEQREEVDQLLHKTRIEMHVTLQPGGPSPKQASGTTSTSQLKPTSDSGQNSGSSFPSKGKKRERTDHGADFVKRERTSRADDGDSVQSKSESNLKYEIARITEKGGVVDLEGIEKLVHLMQPDRKDKTIDLVSRSMLASVMASTDKVDCLNRFVQLRGLLVLDEWLQDIHKGKIGDGNNLKDGDKSVEEFLLVSLSALDKLPVNLHALQTCNIGRSVNHLRSHKNIEIQRKARMLVDTWKKLVVAEMISNDAKTGSNQAAAWSSKSRLPEASQGDSRTPSGSDVAMKSLVTQNSAAKTTSGRSSHGESSIKCATSSPRPVKPASPLASGKESQPKTSAGGTAETPIIREDRSSSSNQSQNYGQSSSKKEDLQSSISGSLTANKMSSSSSTRSLKMSSFPGTAATGSQKEISSSRSSSANKSTPLEKAHSLTNERIVEGPVIEESSHKLIVKIPNRVRSPALAVSGGGSLEDPNFIISRASSPVILNKHLQFDHASKDKKNVGRSNVASDANMCQNNESNDVLIGSEGAGTAVVTPDDEQSMAAEDSKITIEGPAANQRDSLKSQASSFSPMNALIESCVKYSEATSSSLVDDVGMNLLASVAAGEMSRSDGVSPTDSVERSVIPVEEVRGGDEAKSNNFPEDNAPGVQNQFSNDSECDGKKEAVLDDGSISDGGLHLSKHPSVELSGDGKPVQSHSTKDTPDREGTKDLGSSGMDLRSTADPKWEIGESGVNGVVTVEKDGTDRLTIDQSQSMAAVAVSKPLDIGHCNKTVNEGLIRTTNSKQKQIAATVESEFAERAHNGNHDQTECGQKSVSESGGTVKREPYDKDDKSCISKSERLKFDSEASRIAAAESRSEAVSCSRTNDKEAKVENQEIPEHTSVPESRCPGSMDHKAPKEVELTGSMSASIKPSEAGECISTDAGPASSTDSGAKMKFDLNEGFNADDGKYGDSVTSAPSVSRTIHMVSSLSVASNPSVHSASITVAAAAKGPFVHPEDFLRSKVELGWKGSAATSAFRPAEPRKIVEVPLGPANLSGDDASTSKDNGVCFDFDLNVPDERVLEEMASRSSATTDSVTNVATLLTEASVHVPVRGCGGLDIDLNSTDEANYTGNCSSTGNYIGEASIVDVNPFSGLHVRKNFDLNNGPMNDDASVEQYSINQLFRGGITSQLPPAGLRMNNPGIGGFSSWFSPGNTYSTVAIPSILPDRGEQSFQVLPPGAAQRTFGPAGVTPFTPDVYRGSVLSSSPAVPFPSGPFQFPVFPFGTTFPLSSASFPVGATSYAADSSSGPRFFAPPVNSQYLGPVASVASQFQRPYAFNLPEISNNGGLESNRKWARQGLDLNSGPGAMESEAREELLPMSSGQHSGASSHALVEEQARMFSISGGVLKRKDPEGGWENDTFRHKQSSWQ